MTQQICDKYEINIVYKDNIVGLLDAFSGEPRTVECGYIATIKIKQKKLDVFLGESIDLSILGTSLNYIK